MFVLILGGDQTGAHLAELLVEQSHQVRLVEQRREVLARLHQELPTEVIFEGDPTDPEMLEQAGLRLAQVVAVCTANDADNLALSFLARERYNVPRIIARIDNGSNPDATLRGTRRRSAHPRGTSSTTSTWTPGGKCLGTLRRPRDARVTGRRWPGFRQMPPRSPIPF